MEENRQISHEEEFQIIYSFLKDLELNQGLVKCGLSKTHSMEWGRVTLQERDLNNTRLS